MDAIYIGICIAFATLAWIVGISWAICRLADWLSTSTKERT